MGAGKCSYSRNSVPETSAVHLRMAHTTQSQNLNPNLNASEFAEILLKNLQLLHADKPKLMSHDCISSPQQCLGDLTNNLAPLRKDSENPTKNNIVQVIKFIFNNNDELDTALLHVLL